MKHHGTNSWVEHLKINTDFRKVFPLLTKKTKKIVITCKVNRNWIYLNFKWKNNIIIKKTILRWVVYWKIILLLRKKVQVFISKKDKKVKENLKVFSVLLDINKI